MGEPFDALLLVSFGGPEHPGEVLDFLRSVTAGRNVPDERLALVARQYQATGGVSPINRQSRELLDALGRELDLLGGAAGAAPVPRYWATRHARPSLADTLAELHSAGHRRILALTTSAYSSFAGCRQYRLAWQAAAGELGLGVELWIEQLGPYYDLPAFTATMGTSLRAARAELVARGFAPERQLVLFSTHSLPLWQAESSGSVGRGRPGYVTQHRWVCEQVLTAAGLGELAEIDPTAGGGGGWSLVYQSRSGAPNVPWLEPDIAAAITTAAETGVVDAVLVVPVGFTSDHQEVTWDLDHLAAERCSELGLAYHRVPSVGTDSAFCAELAELIWRRWRGDPNAERDCPTDCCVDRHPKFATKIPT
jgi:ferrochelatase